MSSQEGDTKPTKGKAFRDSLGTGGKAPRASPQLVFYPNPSKQEVARQHEQGPSYHRWQNLAEKEKEA